MPAPRRCPNTFVPPRMGASNPETGCIGANGHGIPRAGRRGRLSRNHSRSLSCRADHRCQPHVSARTPSSHPEGALPILRRAASEPTGTESPARVVRVARGRRTPRNSARSPHIPGPPLIPTPCQSLDTFTPPTGFISGTETRCSTRTGRGVDDTGRQKPRELENGLRSWAALPDNPGRTLHASLTSPPPEDTISDRRSCPSTLPTVDT